MLHNINRNGLWQGRRESNPQPTVLETGTLPIELLPYVYNRKKLLTDESHYTTLHIISSMAIKTKQLFYVTIFIWEIIMSEQINFKPYFATRDEDNSNKNKIRFSPLINPSDYTLGQVHTIRRSRDIYNRQIKIKVSEDFSKILGGRFIRDGSNSGEEFFEKLLKPKFKEAITKGSLEIDFDGCYGHPSAFIDEAFTRLLEVWDSKLISSVLKIISTEDKDLEKLIFERIKNTGKELR